MRFHCSWEIPVFILATATIGCQERQQHPEAMVAPALDAEPPAAQLEDAFSTSSTERLVDFLRRWHDSVPPKDIKGIVDPLERELYSAYQDFFNPFALNTIAGTDGYADVSGMYERVNYIIVQNTLRFQVDKTKILTVTDFRPPLAFDNVDVLYLTPTYHQALIAFFERDRSDVENSTKRLQFLNTYAGVHRAHWQGWDLATPPTVDLIELNEKSTRMRVHFSILGDGGVAMMERTTTGWQITDAGIVCIQ